MCCSICVCARRPDTPVEDLSEACVCFCVRTCLVLTGASYHYACSLSEENQSLRSLNMSLIFEREQLMREVAEEEANVKQLKTSVESLLGQVSIRFLRPNVLAVYETNCLIDSLLTGSGPTG